MTALGRLTRPQAALLVAAALLARPLALVAQNRIVWSEEEKPIVDQLRGLRSLDEKKRAKATLQLALRIRRLDPAAHKELLSEQLANLATEGDAGHKTLQEVAATLAQALKQQPPAAKQDKPDMAYVTLAQLVRYEHVQVASDDPQFAAAMSKLEADDLSRQNADFTLTDLAGKSWSLRELRGKVVLVNFWATWCPPCRKEMPDLEALYRQFGPRGLVILAISDEDAAKVQPFVAGQQFTYPILLDPGRKVNGTFRVEGIPKSFVFDREGKLSAQAIDMRTRHQFLAMLAQAGLK
jgi:peroxiredoxin